MAAIETGFKCRNCGKEIDILHPLQWAYKVKNNKGGHWWFCSWKCLREDEANKKPKPKPQKRENKKRLQVLVELMVAVTDGRDAYDFLQGMGYADPKDTLRRLRIKAKKDAPELYQWMEQNGLLDMRKGHSGKGVDKMRKNKLTREQKGKAVDIAIKGGDPLEYLKKCGAKNPSAAWWYIKKTLAKSNPKLLEKIPEKPGTVLDENGQAVQATEKPEGGPKVEIAKKLPPEAVAEVPEKKQTVGVDMGAPEGDKTVIEAYPKFERKAINKPVAKVTELEKTDNGVRFVISVPPEQAEQMDKVLKDIMDPENDRLGLSLYKDAQRITEPLNCDGFRVTAINGEFGEYNVGMNPVSKEDWFEFENLDKKTRISMHRDDLADFIEELTRAAQILGVQV